MVARLWYPRAMRFGWIAGTALLAALGPPAAAQFDPAFNHLFCYGIHEQLGQPQFTPVPVDIETQLGLEQNVSVMRPSFLCAPAKKTGGGVDPLPPIGTAVRGALVCGATTCEPRRRLCAPKLRPCRATERTFAIASRRARRSKRKRARLDPE